MSAVPSMQAWSDLLAEPGLAEFFRGMFEHLGIRVAETGEAFTVHHHGDRFELTEGIDEAAVDTVVDLKAENIANMAAHGQDGTIDRAESFRIVSVLFSPLTRASLAHPAMRNGWLRRFGGIENLIHVHLLDPDGGSANTHTLIHINGEWLVVPGLHGKAKRTYRMSTEQAVDYQKQVFAAIKASSVGGWVAFGGWYRSWRGAVSGR